MVLFILNSGEECLLTDSGQTYNTGCLTYSIYKQIENKAVIWDGFS